MKPLKEYSGMLPSKTPTFSLINKIADNSYTLNILNLNDNYAQTKKADKRILKIKPIICI